MLGFLLIAILVAGAIAFGAFRLGVKSQWWGILLAPVLLRVAWGALEVAVTKPGEGAPSGVAIVMFGGWAVMILCVVVTVAMLVGSVVGQRSWLAGAVMLFGVLPACMQLADRARPGRAASPSSAVPVVNAPPRSTRLDGAAWALDNGIIRESDCVNGTPDFIVGCKMQAAKHPSQD